MQSKHFQELANAELDAYAYTLSLQETLCKQRCANLRFRFVSAAVCSDRV
jgi:hypothetical protein